ncbi:MAG: response regulator transcription factor [bacterium]
MRRILVIDDDVNLTELIKDALVAEGFEVLTAYNAVDGLEVVYNEKIDLIILDIMMPDISGYHVCRLLKDNEKYREIPIVMLTAKAQKTDEFWGLESGADAYITKPFEILELGERINQILK